MSVAERDDPDDETSYKGTPRALGILPDPTTERLPSEGDRDGARNTEKGVACCMRDVLRSRV